MKTINALVGNFRILLYKREQTQDVRHSLRADDVGEIVRKGTVGRQKNDKKKTVSREDENDMLTGRAKSAMVDSMTQLPLTKFLT